jgi:hypothetical protein
LDRFCFHGHDAPWCPFWHPENTKDREIKQRILQYKVTHAIKQDNFPYKFKQAMGSLPVPQQAPLPNPTVKTALTDLVADDVDSLPDNSVPSEYKLLVDTASFEYPAAPMANSAIDAPSGSAVDIQCPFGYRAFQ